MSAKSKNRVSPGKRVRVDRNIYRRQTKDRETRFVIAYTHDGERIYETVGDNLTEARDALAIRMAEIRQGRFDMRRVKRTPCPYFCDFANTYLAHKKEHKRTWKRDELAINAATPILGQKRLDQISSFDLERFKEARTKEVSKACTNRDLAVVRHMLRKAIDWGHIDKNPAATVKAYRVEPKLPRVLSDEEEKKLLQHAAPHLRTFIITGVNTGLRRSELFGLEWNCVDFEKRSITVKRSKSNRIRHIPMNEDVVKALRSLKTKGKRFVFGDGEKRLTDVKTAFLGASRRAGIFPPITPHVLRHSFATRLVMAGCDIVTVQELLGHSSIEMTMRYSHPSPEHKRTAVDSLAQKNRYSIDTLGDVAIKERGVN